MNRSQADFFRFQRMIHMCDHCEDYLIEEWSYLKLNFTVVS